MKDEYKNIQNFLIPFKLPLIYVIVDNPSGWHQNQYVECSHKHDVQPCSVACSPLKLLGHCIAYNFLLFDQNRNVFKFRNVSVIFLSSILHFFKIRLHGTNKTNVFFQIYRYRFVWVMEALKAGKFLTCWGKPTYSSHLFTSYVLGLFTSGLMFFTKATKDEECSL